MRVKNCPAFNLIFTSSSSTKIFRQLKKLRPVEDNYIDFLMLKLKRADNTHGTYPNNGKPKSSSAKNQKQLHLRTSPIRPYWKKVQAERCLKTHKKYRLLSKNARFSNFFATFANTKHFQHPKYFKIVTTLHKLRCEKHSDIQQVQLK